MSGDCLLPVGPKSFVLSFVLYKKEVIKYKEFILCAVFCGCVSWSLALRE